jgi:hypothetical protein
MGQMIRQLTPNTTRYYWYPGDKKAWLRALIAAVSGGAVYGVTLLFTHGTLTAAVLGLAVAAGIFGYNLGRRDLQATDTLTPSTPRRDIVSTGGRASWRGFAEGAVAALSALIIAGLGATGFWADWVLPLVPAVVGGISRQAALMTERLTHRSEPATVFMGPAATRRAPDPEPGPAV